jgi:hypothetical protein
MLAPARRISPHFSSKIGCSPRDIGLDRRKFASHSIRRTKPTLICRRTVKFASRVAWPYHVLLGNTRAKSKSRSRFFLDTARWFSSGGTSPLMTLVVITNQGSMFAKPACPSHEARCEPSGRSCTVIFRRVPLAFFGRVQKYTRTSAPLYLPGHLQGRSALVAIRDALTKASKPAIS